MNKRLEAMCRTLNLPVTADRWSAMAQQASTDNIAYSTFLYNLLEEEVAAKHARSVQTLLKFARLPFRKTLDDFDFPAQPSVDHRRIQECATLSFIEANENLIFLGPPGIGKTHLAVSLGLEAIAHGYKTYFVTAHELVLQCQKADAEGRLEKKIRSLVKPSVLIIDEMGYMKLDPGSAHYLFQVIARRYERGPILLTSNKAFGEWGEIMGDSIIATAMLDRLLHHSHIFNMKGESYRMKEKQKED
jgi:DNA replication protein DnaC